MINEKILGILANPKNVGQMRDANGTGKVKGQDCHDFSKLFVKVENRVITETKFQTYGNPISIAAVSVVSELIKNKTIDEILEIKIDEILSELGEVTKDQMPCVQNALDLIPSCVASYYRKQEKKGEESEKQNIQPKKSEVEPQPHKAEDKKNDDVITEPENEEQEDTAIEDMDIFSEIDEITAKISEAVNKMKKK